MKIVVGLGNPGQKYNQTRHNVGFEVLACLAQRWMVDRPKAKFNAEVAEINLNQEKTILVSPLTFMNLSGKSVRAAIDFYKLPISEVLVICDDINLDVGRLRLRASGSAGGQNGLKDIIRCLGSDQFPRLRVGVGRVPAGWDAADFVLGKFNPEDRSTMDSAVPRAADAVECWVKQGLPEAMNRFNADPNQPKQRRRPPEREPAPDDGADSGRGAPDPSSSPEN